MHSAVSFVTVYLCLQ